MFIVSQAASTMRGASADIQMYQGQPIPYAFQHLLNSMTALYVFVAPIAMVPKLLWFAAPVGAIVAFFVAGFSAIAKPVRFVSCKPKHVLQLLILVESTHPTETKTDARPLPYSPK